MNLLRAGLSCTAKYPYSGIILRRNGYGIINQDIRQFSKKPSNLPLNLTRIVQVYNLPPTTTMSDIESLVAEDIGSVSNISLDYTSQLEFKGNCFIEFTSAKEAAKFYSKSTAKISGASSDISNSSRQPGNKGLWPSTTSTNGTSSGGGSSQDMRPRNPGILSILSGESGGRIGFKFSNLTLKNIIASKIAPGSRISRANSNIKPITTAGMEKSDKGRVRIMISGKTRTKAKTPGDGTIQGQGNEWERKGGRKEVEKTGYTKILGINPGLSVGIYGIPFQNVQEEIRNYSVFGNTNNTNWTRENSGNTYYWNNRLSSLDFDNFHVFFKEYSSGSGLNVRSHISDIIEHDYTSAPVGGGKYVYKMYIVQFTKRADALRFIRRYNQTYITVGDSTGFVTDQDITQEAQDQGQDQNEEEGEDVNRYKLRVWNIM